MRKAKLPARADDFFRDRYGITPREIERVFGRELARHADHADIYFEYTLTERLELEEGIVKQATHAVRQGAGVRATVGERSGYAHSDDISTEKLLGAARTARSIAEGTSERTVVAFHPKPSAHDLYPVESSLAGAPVAPKVDLLSRVDEAARRHDPRVKNVIATLSSQTKIVLIATADGVVVGDVQPLLSLSVTCIAEERGRREAGRYGGGGRVGFEFLLDDEAFARFAREAARQAVVGLGAVEAPAGFLTVVLAPGWPGILLHEAIGHGLEGDFNRKKTSAFSGRLGEKVASEVCTVVDDGTLPWRRGSLNVDDEGTPTRRTVLIEKGVLRGYMQDRLNARLMGMEPTGNGRRESFKHLPMPRMTNTFMLAGEEEPEDVIRSVDRGLYAVSFGGGQVDITNGKFVFSASEAYLIEKGKVTAPVRGATLVGNGPDVLTRVSRVARDLMLDEGMGMCGKDGQGVPVGVGLPTIRIDGITVGGTKR